MPELVGFQTMVILDPYGMTFDAVGVFGLAFHLLFRSWSTYCAGQKWSVIWMFLCPNVSISSCQRNLMKTYHNEANTKVRCLYQCSKMQFITFQNFHIQTWFSQFLWFFSLKCWFKGQMISRIHLILPNAYKLMCFDRNINGNRNVKFLECDKWSLHWYKNLTLVRMKCFAIFVKSC